MSTFTPTKLEVRFTDSGRVYARLLQTLRHHFLTTDMTMRVGPAAPDPLQDTGYVGAATQSSHALPPAESLHRQTVIDWARSGVDRSNAVAASLPDFRPFPDSRAAFFGKAANAATMQSARVISLLGNAKPLEHQWLHRRTLSK